MSHHHHRADPDTSPTNLTPFKGAKVPSPNLEPRSTPNLHHHHVPRHHHHHHHVNAKPSAPVNIIVPLVKSIIRNQAVLDQVAGLPRFNLGSTYYKSELRPGGPALHSKLTKKGSKHVGGFSSTPKPLPRFAGKENSIFTVKIPQVYLGEISRREITKRRAVWGTDIYTDDSDVIAACIHQGWFRGAWNDDVDVDLLDLEIEVDGPREPFNVHETMTSPPLTGPVAVPEGYGCHVKIVVLPLLQKYASLTRFGLKSREWGFQRDGYTSVHDGVSFMIHSIDWVKGVDEQEGRNRASRSKIFAKQLDDRELEQESQWDELLRKPSPMRDYSQESFERGARPGDIQDTKPWITGINKPEPKGKEKEVENSPTPEPEMSLEPPLPRILGPLPPPIPSPLSSPIMAPEPLEEEEVTPNMAALLASSLEAERAFVKPQQHQRMTSSQEIRIERVTERMIENANLLEEPIRTEMEVEVPVAHPHESNMDKIQHHEMSAMGFDPIAALADIAVANEQAEAAAKALVPMREDVQGARIKMEPVEPSVQDVLGTPSIFG